MVQSSTSVPLAGQRPEARLGGMAPATDTLPDTLPTDRLLANGRPRRELRDELRRIPSLRNAGSVLGVYVASFGVIAAAAWLHNPVGWLVAFLLMGPAFARFLILAHEAAHRLLFARRGVNDLVGRWLLAYPGFVPFDGYRRSHMAHHRNEMGPNEPDIPLYAEYPIQRDSWRRKLTRDIVGRTGWRLFKPLFGALASRNGRAVAIQILATQAVILAGFTLAGWPQLYFLLWLAPYLTVWRLLNRLRAVAEHGGMMRSSDRRQTTHHIRQTWIPRALMVPYHTGWHLAHHVDAGVPWRNLPRLHQELTDARWLAPELEYSSYREFWQAASSG